MCLPRISHRRSRSPLLSFKGRYPARHLTEFWVLIDTPPRICYRPDRALPIDRRFASFSESRSSVYSIYSFHSTPCTYSILSLHSPLEPRPTPVLYSFPARRAVLLELRVYPVLLACLSRFPILYILSSTNSLYSSHILYYKFRENDYFENIYTFHTSHTFYTG